MDLHLSHPLTHSLSLCLVHVCALAKGASRPFAEDQQALVWILDNHTRLLLFADLVMCYHNTTQTVHRQANVRTMLLNRMRDSYNQITCTLAKILNPTFDVTKWMEQVAKDKKSS